MLQAGTAEYIDVYTKWARKYRFDPDWGGRGQFSPDLAVQVRMHRGYRTPSVKLAATALREATELGLLPFPNVPALRKSTEWVQEQDRLLNELGIRGNVFWNQGTWRSVDLDYADEVWNPETNEFEYQVRDCKTAMCFAGHACDVAGVKWKDPGEDDSVVVLTTEVQASFPFAEQWVKTYGHDVMPIAHFAEAHLGITSGESAALFHGENSAADIEWIVGVILDRAGERL